MKIALFSAKPYDIEFFGKAVSSHGHQCDMIEARLTALTASLASGYPAVCVFVNDSLDAETLRILREGGTQFVALRCAGFNNVDLHAAQSLGMAVVRVPAYSPFAVAEHAVALILALDRKIHRAHSRVREGNFSLDGLMGFDLHGATVGVVGTGHIGRVFCGIMRGFGCTVIAHDIVPHEECRKHGVRYVSLDELYAASDIVSLHCPLTPDTYHMISAATVARMKDGVMIINTSRGALVDASALIDGLKSGKIGSVGLDVYEEEADLFFEDLSNTVITDDVFARLTTFPNVLVTGHQAFFTRQALENIASVTLTNLSHLEKGEQCVNEVRADAVSGRQKKP